MHITSFLVGLLAIFTPSIPASKKGEISSSSKSEIYTVDYSRQHQTIDNFAASDAWRMEFVGRNWPQEKKNHLADLLFSHEYDEQGNPRGMALSAWRVNIGAGSYENRDNGDVKNSWNRVECFLSPDGTYDFSKASGQQWFMNAARERGTNSFVFFSNSAPYFMTRTGKTLTTDLDSINLRTDQFDDFARFLVHCAEHFQSQGYNIDYISPINEPNVPWMYNTNQEGTVARDQDVYRVAYELDKAISQSGKIHSRILIPEMGDMKNLFKLDTQDQEGNDIPGALPNDILNTFFTPQGEYSVLGFKNLYPCVAAHDYWSAYPEQLLVETRQKIHSALQAAGQGVGFWASEYCILEENQETTTPPSPTTSMNLALYIARLIHCNLAIADAKAWQWWTAVSLDEDVSIQLKPLAGATMESVASDGEICPTKMLWATANYSFFIRPGMVRVDIQPKRESSDLEAATHLMASAYTDGQKTVVVYVNCGHEDREVSLFCGKHQRGKVYETSLNHNLRYMGTSKLRKLHLPARSIVTVVI